MCNSEGTGIYLYDSEQDNIRTEFVRDHTFRAQSVTAALIYLKSVGNRFYADVNVNNNMYVNHTDHHENNINNESDINSTQLDNDDITDNHNHVRHNKCLADYYTEGM